MAVKSLFKKLGPGLISGAADDDPSGIATYSIAGAKFGYQFLWSAFFTLPLMIAVQETCARIAVVTKKDLAGVIKAHYPRQILIIIAGLLFAANTFNIGADVAGMASALKLLLPVPELAATFTVLAAVVASTIFFPYRVVASVFKWLTLALFSYIFAFLFTKPDILLILRQTFIPDLALLANNNYVLTLLAVFGTTISPYVLFWQASQEAEEEKLIRGKYVLKSLINDERKDTIIGMGFSNFATFFIIAAAGATLYKAGINNIQTAAEAASALRPLAGDLAYLLFAVGIIGTGILAVPVLAGSAAYSLAEAFNLPYGLNKTFNKARAFYLIIVVSTILGFIMNLLGLNPFEYLFYSAVVNGAVTPIIIGLLIIIANNPKIMGKYRNGPLVNFLSIITILIMSLALAVIFGKI